MTRHVPNPLDSHISYDTLRRLEREASDADDQWTVRLIHLTRQGDIEARRAVNKHLMWAASQTQSSSQETNP